LTNCNESSVYKVPNRLIQGGFLVDAFCAQVIQAKMESKATGGALGMMAKFAGRAVNAVVRK
jgi:hypothetical protein